MRRIPKIIASSFISGVEIIISVLLKILNFQYNVKLAKFGTVLVFYNEYYLIFLLVIYFGWLVVKASNSDAFSIL